MPSRIALGTVQFGTNYGIANSTGQVGLAESAAILDFARTAGIDTLDTAVAYGSAEQRLGELGVSDFRIVTKLPALAGDAPLPKRWVLDQLETSLERLRVSQLDSLLLHRPADLGGPDGQELAAQLIALKRQGLVKKIGVSIYRPSDIKDALALIPVDLVQAPMNVIDRRISSSGWIDRLADMGIELHVRSIFLQGLLLLEQERIPEQFSPWRQAMDAWHRWLDEEQVSAVDACVAHAASFAAVSRLVVGCDGVAQLRQIVAASERSPATAPSTLESSDEMLIDPSRWSRR